MTLSQAMKYGGGAATAGIGLPSSIYFAHNYATSLYEVEQKIIDEDLLLSIDKEQQEIKIEVSDFKGEDKGKYSWFCLITTTYPKEKGIAADPELIFRLKHNLFTTETSSVEESKRKENKELLVRVCAKHRTGISSNNSVQANITLREAVRGPTDSWFFTDEQLDILATKNQR